jgi:hypothetical protein
MILIHLTGELPERCSSTSSLQVLKMMNKMNKKSTGLIVPDEIIMNKIFLIRGQKVMLDRDLAELYDVETKRLNEQLKRNPKRFPSDFMFHLTEDEKNEVVANCDHLKSLKYSPYPPYAFTEHGVLMLSSVLNSDRAIEVNIKIMRIFTRFRKMLMENTDIRLAIEKLERKTENNTKNIEVVFRYMDELIEEKEKTVEPIRKKESTRKLIGYKVPKRV